MISRKNIIQLVVLVVAVIGIILARVYFHQGTETKSPPTSNIPATPRMLTYTNPAYSIQYPTNWKKTQEKEEITFSSPLESSADTFQEKLSIGPLAGPSTNLDGFFKEYVDMLKKAAAVDNPSDTTLGGYPAHTVIFTVKPKDQPLLKMMQIFTQKGTKLYGITYRAEPDKYDANFATIQTMLQSFKITDSTTPASAPLPSPTDALCGNKIVDADENCLTCPADVKCLADYTCSNDGTCLAPASTCGNAKVEGLEKCDDGNLVAGDGCAPNCKKEGFCVPNELLCHSNLARAKCDKYGTDHVAILPCAFYGEGSVCKDGACTE